MNITQARAKLARILNIAPKRVVVREDRNAPDNDAREALRELLREATETHTQTKLARDKRMDELLAADERYQQLKAGTREAFNRMEKYRSRLSCHRVMLGKIVDSGIAGFGPSAHIIAEGETFNDAFAKLEAKRGKS
jgi:hypothetical protein